MASIFRRKEKTHPNDLFVEFKQTGTTGSGDPIYAEVLALEPASIGGGGTGSAVSIADGSDVAQGTTSDAAWVSGSGTVIALLKKIASAGGSAVSVADGADVAQGTTTDLASASTVIGLLKNLKAALAGTLTTSVSNFPATQPVSGSVSVSNFPATQPVSLATNTPDVTDRAARLLGHVTVDNASIPVTGPLTDTQLRATRVPVDASGVAVPVTDNAGSLTVDAPVGTPVWVRLSDGAAAFVGQKAMAASIPVVVASDQSALPVTGTFFQATQPVSGTVTANQGGAPWAENLTQIAGTALAAKALPANADGQVAIPVYVNAQQYATYDVAARNIATGALTANTAKAVLSLEHALASTKTVRIRRIMIHAIQTTALSGLFDVEITRGTAASSAGTAVVPQSRRLTDPAAEVVVKSLPTIVAATVADNIPAGGFGATTALYSPPVLVYDWQEAGETKPYMLVAGALQSLVINVISTAAHNLTLTVSVDLTEE